MTTYDWLTSSRINELERTVRQLLERIDKYELASEDNAALITDVRILAMQAYLMYFHQLVALSPNPEEFRVCSLRTLKAQGLSKHMLKEIEQWTARICGANAEQDYNNSDNATTPGFSEQEQSALIS